MFSNSQGKNPGCWQVGIGEKDNQGKSILEGYHAGEDIADAVRQILREGEWVTVFLFDAIIAFIQLTEKKCFVISEWNAPLFFPYIDNRVPFINNDGNGNKEIISVERTLQDEAEGTAMYIYCDCQLSKRKLVLTVPEVEQVAHRNALTGTGHIQSYWETRTTQLHNYLGVGKWKQWSCRNVGRKSSLASEIFYTTSL